MGITANMTEKVRYTKKYQIVDITYTSAPRNIGGRSGREQEQAKVTKKQRNSPQAAFERGEISAELCAKIKHEESVARSIRNTKQKIREFYDNHLLGEKVRFFTLTFKNEPELNRKTADLLHFCFAAVGAAEGHKVMWLAVPEYGEKNGRLHFHVLANTNYYTNEEFARRFWQHGFVRMKRIKTLAGQNKKNAPVEYILKYIGKDITDKQKYKKRVYVSKAPKVAVHTSNHTVRHSQTTGFVAQLKSIGFKMNRSKIFETADVGLVCKWQLIRPISEAVEDLPHGSFYSYFQNIKKEPGYQLFDEPQRVTLSRENLAEEFPETESWLDTPAVRSLYFQAIGTRWRYRRLQKAYYADVRDVRMAIEHQLKDYDFDFAPARERLLRENVIESFEDFLLKIFYSYEPESYRVREC